MKITTKKIAQNENKFCPNLENLCEQRIIYGFWHIGLIGCWEKIINLQIAKIIKSGLYKASTKIYVVIVGTENMSLSIFDGYSKFEIIFKQDHKALVNDREYVTLSVIKGKANKENFYCWYIHSKGSTSSLGNTQSGPWHWREYMEYYIICCWNFCLRYLDKYDLVGVEWSDGYIPHYSGNFWWSKSSYLKERLEISEFRNLYDRPGTRHEEVWATCNTKNTGKHISLFNYGNDLYTYICEEKEYEIGKNFIKKYVTEKGSGNVEGFGGTFSGGYYTQQNPDEISELILFLLKTCNNRNSYLEIGAASGGSAKLIDDFLLFDNIYIIDNNEHPHHVYRKTILPYAIEYIGDSHSDKCREYLKKMDKVFDVVFIDGDHSFDGIKKDTEMVLPYLERGSFIIYHDAHCPLCPGVATYLSSLDSSSKLKMVKDINDDKGLGIQVFEIIK
jgi:predicted O-methyltransferase YrrM